MTISPPPHRPTASHDAAPLLAPPPDLQDELALICAPADPDAEPRTMTFGELHQEAERFARGLLAEGFGPGTRTALLVRPGPEFMITCLGLLRVGAVPILVDPGLGRRHLASCFARAKPEAFIGEPVAHLGRLLLGWGRGSVTKTITVGRRRLLARSTFDRIRRTSWDGAFPEVPLDAPGLVGFTSGSTGPPKGVVYRREQLLHQRDVASQLFGWRPGSVDLATMPLFALPAAAAGVTAVLPEMDFTRPAKADPEMLARVIQRFEVTSMFASPALLDPLSRWTTARGIVLSTLERVISAGAPVPASVVERCTSMLPPDARLSTPYGATEALPATTIDAPEILEQTADATVAGAGVCVGRPVDGAEVEVIALTDGPIGSWAEVSPLPTGQIGEFAVRAPWVSARYLNDPENTERAKIPVDDGSFYHRMGDVGYRDETGRLWFCGRVAERVETDDGAMFTAPCEEVFNAHPAVLRSALVGPTVDGRVRPTICIELDPTQPAPADLERELLELGARHEHTRTIRDVLVHPRFPVDVRHNAKIGRPQLRDWAQRKLGGR